MPEDQPQDAQQPPNEAVAKEYPAHVARAGEFVAPLAGASIAAVAFAAVNAVAGPLTLSPALSGLVALQVLAAAVIGAAAVLVECRARVVSEARELAELAEERAERATDGSQSMFSGEVSEEQDESVAVDALTQYGRTLQPLALVIAGAGVAAIALISFWNAKAAGASSAFFALGVVNLAGAFLWMTGARWFSSQEEEALPESEAVASMLRAMQWSAVLGALAILAHGLGAPVFDRWVGLLLLLLALALAGEQLARAALVFLGRRREWVDIRAPIGLVVAESLFAGANPIASTLEILEKRFGVSVRSSYVLGYMRRAIPAVLVGMIALFWLTTSFVSIEPEEVGILTRFGRLPTDGWFGPGLHVKLPSLIDGVEKLPAERIQVITVGHESEERLPYMLWSRTHIEEEYKLVLGEGRELLSLDAMIYYRINDPIKYRFNSQNPQEIMKAFAYRVLMRQTVGSDLGYVLSEGRMEFSTRFQDALQRDLDAQDLGIEVIKVALRGIHPPIEVAQAYQAVVSAQVERVTLETQAEAKRAEAVPAAEAAKNTAIKKAGAVAATRLGDARGEATGFTSVEAAYSAAPELYRERLWLETLEDAIAGKRLYVVEGGAKASNDYWVDLREGARLP